MNYYIQGSSARAKEIKAAFEGLGCDVTGFDMRNDNILFFTYKLQTGANVISTTNAHLCIANIIKTHPDYQELELPKPHYEIKNFKPFDKVLVRDFKRDKWRCAWFSDYDKTLPCPFITTGADYKQCIPFEVNKHLLGTTNMPSEECINW